MESDVKIERLLRKGAEASLYLGSWFGNEALFKQRITKKYRSKALDEQIRKTRTINEGKALIKVKTYGVNVPQVFEINNTNSTIIMKYIPGTKLKDLMEEINNERKIEIFQEVGRQIALLHLNGHIHGDITTSNVIVTSEKEVFLIDFGLHDSSDKIEDKGVDLHLLKRVLISTHGNDYSLCFEAFLTGYKTEYEKQNNRQFIDVIKQISVVETRGRYVKKKERK